MRRFLILAMFLLGSTVVLTAQEEIVLFSDDFEDGTLDQWTLVDADCDGHNWYISEYEGNHTAYSSSMVSNPDNYLISPWLLGATRIEFKIWTDFDSDDYYEVLASSTGDQLEDFSVYDNTGRMVLQEHYKGHLNVSALPKGVYSVTVAGRTVKFVKD